MNEYDVVVIGSGIGGAMAAYPLVQAGLRVLMIERGPWIARGPQNWRPEGVGIISHAYDTESPYRVIAGRQHTTHGRWSCVGGQSVFYGATSYRLRESDFDDAPDIVGESGAAWPFTYAALEPYYTRAEQLLGVAGTGDDDPTEPWHSHAYAQPPRALSRPARAIVAAAARLGMRASRLPLAISVAADGDRSACVGCITCNGYPCAAEAKNDVATAVIPRLVRQGMALRPNTVCVRLVRERSRIVAVECVHRVTGERARVAAGTFVLSAGTLATAHLLLASGLTAVNPAGDHVGRYMVRHKNAFVFGFCARDPNPAREFDRQVAIMDLYAEAGSIQQTSLPEGLVRAYVPAPVRAPAAAILSHSLVLMAMAEDQPRWENHVALDMGRRDRYGVPGLTVRHAYTAHDEAKARRLVAVARRVLHEAKAIFTFVRDVRTFSHAMGTVRMGVDERTSPVDADGAYRGIDNLYLADGSTLPRAGAVNPSLTIAANALRVGTGMARLAIRRPARQHAEAFG